ncbi:hypothetical protein [Rhodococcus sp. HNM0563]|uniref:hypothetical protein n=1 Tax=Rhodococcus sp. HNM0563 TaxID=2716339 RepID=UPI00197D2D67|nr:hypothetical protein [Rhodococcus sp. HNM0563]
MSPSVTSVTAWNPDALRATAGALDDLVDKLDDRMRGPLDDHDVLSEQWKGDAANQVSLLRALLPSGATYDTASLQLARQAAELSVALVDALQQAAAGADDATGRIRAAVVVLEDAAKAAAPGVVVKSASREFSLVPDVPATVAASTIGLMSDGTKEGLKSATLSSGDDIGRGIARGLGPFAAMLGTIPAINNDIEGGMDPTKAVITEGAGSAVGFATGTYAGTKLGGIIGTAIVPGIGTAAGLLIGAAVGGLFTWGVSKGAQAAWN